MSTTEKTAPEQKSLRSVYGAPEASTAQSCDEHCEPHCVFHTASVGWDLSFGSRINFHPVDTADGRLVVALHLSDDALANRGVYREVTPDQLTAFAKELLALVGSLRGQDDMSTKSWCNGRSIGTAAPCGASNRHAPHGEGERPAWFDHD